MSGSPGHRVGPLNRSWAFSRSRNAIDPGSTALNRAFPASGSTLPVTTTYRPRPINSRISEFFQQRREERRKGALLSDKASLTLSGLRGLARFRIAPQWSLVSSLLPGPLELLRHAQPFARAAPHPTPVHPDDHGPLAWRQTPRPRTGTTPTGRRIWRYGEPHDDRAAWDARLP